MPRANGKCPEEPQRPNLGTARWTFEPVALLYLGKVMLEALVLCLSLLGLCVLRSHPCLRICLRLRLRQRRRELRLARLLQHDATMGAWCTDSLP